MITHCNYCGKELNTTQQGMLRHITRFYVESGNLSKDERWFRAVSWLYDSRLADKEVLCQLYDIEQMSITDIAKRFDCDHLMIHRAFERHGIEKRTQSESRKNAQSKVMSTCLERYGAVNPLSKGTIIEQHRNETVKRRYGVSNVFMNSSVIKKCISSMKRHGYKKRINTMISKYGTASPFGFLEVRAKINKSFLKGSRGYYISSLNRRAYEVLAQHHIEYEPEFMITKNKKTVSYDLRVGKLLIELNGDHFHANPMTHSHDEIVAIPGHPCVASEIWEKDAKKAQIAIDEGFVIVTLWENDLKSNFENVLLRAINENM